MTSNVTKLIEELDAVDGVLFHLQRNSISEGARVVQLTPLEGENVQHIRPFVAMPGDIWQALEAMKGLAWVLRHLCEELRGRGHE